MRWSITTLVAVSISSAGNALADCDSILRQGIFDTKTRDYSVASSATFHDMLCSTVKTDENSSTTLDSSAQAWFGLFSGGEHFNQNDAKHFFQHYCHEQNWATSFSESERDYVSTVHDRIVAAWEQCMKRPPGGFGLTYEYLDEAVTPGAFKLHVFYRPSVTFSRERGQPSVKVRLSGDEQVVCDGVVLGKYLGKPIKVGDNSKVLRCHLKDPTHSGGIDVSEAGPFNFTRDAVTTLDIRPLPKAEELAYLDCTVRFNYRASEFKDNGYDVPGNGQERNILLGPFGKNVSYVVALRDAPRPHINLRWKKAEDRLNLFIAGPAKEDPAYREIFDVLLRVYYQKGETATCDPKGS